MTPGTYRHKSISSITFTECIMETSCFFLSSKLLNKFQLNFVLGGNNK